MQCFGNSEPVNVQLPPFLPYSLNANSLSFTAVPIQCHSCHCSLPKAMINFSSCGYLGQIKGKEPEAGKLREKFATSDSTLTVDELCQMMNNFVESAQSGDHRELGWPSNTYVVSKVGLSALSRIQQRQFNEDSRKVKNNFLLLLTSLFLFG